MLMDSDHFYVLTLEYQEIPIVRTDWWKPVLLIQTFELSIDLVEAKARETMERTLVYATELVL